MSKSDTIVAQVTPPGRGGVSIVRVSGADVKKIAKKILNIIPKPRQAEYLPFKDVDESSIDIGLAVFFPNPHSFTGEDVLELQGHGSPIALDRLLKRILNLGARMARPGEFSERAFLNDKIDLTQAEAIADLIECGSEQAARSAMHSLEGEFSKLIHHLVDKIIHLRMYTEASLDFSEEEIDFLNGGKILNKLKDIISDLEHIQHSAQQGALLREGINVVIAGQPNVGKSTLLNALSGRDSAIVTDIPGTTRDLMHEQIFIDGLPLHIIDTAGLRNSTDIVEQEGIRRAQKAMEKADHILLISDAQQNENKNSKKMFLELESHLPPHKSITIIRNKIDLTNEEAGIQSDPTRSVISLSAKQGQGVELLREYLKESVAYRSSGEGKFIARRRHLDALERTAEHLYESLKLLKTNQAVELLAEELRWAQQALSEITGEFTSEDLLEKIFSSFCIGK